MRRIRCTCCGKVTSASLTKESIKCALRLWSLCATPVLLMSFLTVLPGSLVGLYTSLAYTVPATSSRRQHGHATHKESVSCQTVGRCFLLEGERDKRKREFSSNWREASEQGAQMAEAAQASIRGRAEEMPGELWINVMDVCAFSEKNGQISSKRYQNVGVSLVKLFYVVSFDMSACRWIMNFTAAVWF